MRRSAHAIGREPGAADIERRAPPCNAAHSATVRPPALGAAIDIVRRSPLPMAVLCPSHGVANCNEAYLGFARGEGPDVSTARDGRFPPNLAKLHRTALDTVLRRRPFSLPDHQLVITRQGRPEQAWVDLDCCPIVDEAGTTIGALVVMTDATKRVVAETALARLRENLEDRASAWTGLLGRSVATLEAEIAGRRAAEDALRQSQKMEAVGQLTGGIAHDFNNLLTGIIGSLDLLQRRIGQGRFDEAERFATIAKTSANRAAALTHRLLTFARRQPVDLQVVDLARRIASIEDLLRRTLVEKIELHLSLPPGLWRVECDPNQLDNAVLNLAINSPGRDAERGQSPHRGQQRRVDEAAAKAWEFKSGEYVVISVKDTGSGMHPDAISRAFEPFFTTKPLGLGTGLGLPMVYGFARQSARIGVDRELDRRRHGGEYLPAPATGER